MTRIYNDAAQFEALFTRLFAEIAAKGPASMNALVRRRMVICFAVREPEVEMWVDGRDIPVQATFGHSDLPATLTAELTGDTLHELLLGTLPLGKALRRRKLKVEGSIFQAMKLESLLHACQADYPALARELLTGEQ